MQVLLLIALTTQQPASPPPPPPAAKPTIEFTGTVLMNGVYNSARTNNSAIPGRVATQPASVKRTSRPCLEGRLRLGWGPSDVPSEVAIGRHIGWLRGVYNAGTDSMIQSHAITFDTRIKLGRAELIGEAFS